MQLRVVEKPSPNWSLRREGVPVDTVVVHSTAGGLQGTLAWLTNKASQVSAHYVIARDGLVYKLVPLRRVAWHAGRKVVGFSRANQRSVGIELVQTPSESPTEEQVTVLKALIKQIRTAYPIRYLVGHKEINPTKHDPWGLDLDELRSALGLVRPERAGKG